LLIAGGLFLLAIVCFGLYRLIQFSQSLSLLLAIAAAAFVGCASFALLAILWRRVCGRRGHAFREVDVFPGGRTKVYECRHCGEHRYVRHEVAENA